MRPLSHAIPIAAIGAMLVASPLAGQRGKLELSESSNPTYFLGVGIDRYENWTDTLRGAVNDLNSMAAVLDSLYQVQVHDSLMLTNEDATREAIEKLITDFVYSANSSTSAIFYFAGHGTRAKDDQEVFLIAHDGKLEPHSMDNLLADSYAVGYVNWLALSKVLNLFVGYGLKVESRLKQVLVILDACYAGGLHGRSFWRFSDNAKRAEDILHTRWTREILTAAPPGGRAHERREGGEFEGLFTGRLQRELQAAAVNQRDSIVYSAKIKDKVETAMDSVIKNDPALKGRVRGVETKPYHGYFGTYDLFDAKGENRGGENTEYVSKFALRVRGNAERQKRADLKKMIDGLTAAHREEIRRIENSEAEGLGACPERVDKRLAEVEAILAIPEESVFHDDAHTIRFLLQVQCAQSKWELPRYLCDELKTRSKDDKQGHLIPGGVWQRINKKYDDIGDGRPGSVKCV